MKAYIIIQSISLGDSAGCDTLLMKRALSEMGIESAVYALRMSVEAAYTGQIKSYNALPEINEDDIVIFVHKEGDCLCEKLKELGGRKLLVYHEPVRPKALKKDYSCPEYEDIRTHYLSTQRIINIFDGAEVFSLEGRGDLLAMGCDCPVMQRNVMLSEEYYKTSDRGVLPEEMSGDYINMVYCGSIIPDSHTEELIAAYSCYRKHYNRRSRLILLSDGVMSKKYRRKLKKYAELLSTEGIIFSEAASAEKRGSYIKNADVYISGTGDGSFPEGAAAAVFEGIPVVAWDCSSVRLLFKSAEGCIEDAEPKAAAALIHRIVSDSGFREQLLKVQSEEAYILSYENEADLFIGHMKNFINNKLGE